MSRLDELLQELCPDGVEYGKIGDLVDYEQPSKYIVSSTNYNDNYDVPVLTAGQSFILGYTDETDGVCEASKDNPVIIFDDFTGAFKWVDFPFKVKSSAMKILKPKLDVAIFRYVFHLMGWLNYTSSEHKRLWIGIYSEFEVPVPPLKIQSEVVRILDKFTELTAELTTELIARRKQMNYYRTVVLNSCEIAEEHILEEVADIIDCPHSSPKWQTEGVPCIRNFNLVNGIIDTSNLSYVSEEDYVVRTKRVVPAEGDILFSREAPIGNVGIVEKGFRCCQGQRVVLLRPKLNVIVPRFLLHVLQGEVVKQQIFKVELGGTTVSNYNLSDLRKLKITVPIIKEQMRIVEMLDVMNQYSIDINDGLPAEIRCRQLQFEYYRDKLLMFERVSEG